MIDKTLFQNKYRIESSRLREWDYSNSAAYFITICTKNKLNFLSNIRNEKVILTTIGKIIKDEWLRTPRIRNNIILDEYVIMPNHLHGIIMIFNNEGLSVETSRRDVSDLNKNPAIDLKTHFETLHRSVSTDMKSNSLSSIINQFKSKCTKRIKLLSDSDFAWQPRFYDHIIRTEKGLDNIRDYIKLNPAKWNSDEYYKN